jgi:hypothetical protein
MHMATIVAQFFVVMSCTRRCSFDFRIYQAQSVKIVQPLQGRADNFCRGCVMGISFCCRGILPIRAGVRFPQLETLSRCDDVLVAVAFT